MQPQREGYDEPEPTGHPGSTQTIYSVGWPVNRLPRMVTPHSQVGSHGISGSTNTPGGNGPRRHFPCLGGFLDGLVLPVQ